MLQVAVSTYLSGVKNHIHVATFVKPYKDHHECVHEMFTNDVIPGIPGSVISDLEVDV